MRASVVLHYIKPGVKLVGKLPIQVQTYTPPGYNKDSTACYAESVRAWRLRGRTV